MRMRILQINAVYGVKSTGRNCKELHDWAVEHGHEMLTVYGNEPKIDVPETEAIFLGSHFEHKLHALTGRLAGDTGVGSWRATRKLMEIIRDYNPHVIHLNNLHANFINIGMLLRYISKQDIPTVVSLHDCYFFTGGCMHYTANNCYKWQKDCKDCRFLKRGKDYIFKNRAHHNLVNKVRLFQAIPRLAVCGVSEWTARQARLSPAFEKAKIITHIYNWVNLDIFKPKGEKSDSEIKNQLGIAGKTMILGVASGWSKKKGLEDFVFLNNLLSDQYRIVLIGGMPNDINLPEKIISVPSIEDTETLARYYSAADVFVHLSIEETFGKVIAEALACGTPAIVYDSTALPELVSPETGIVISPGNREDIFPAISELFSKKDIFRNCRDRAERLFDFRKNTEEQFDCYRRLVN